MKKLFVVQISTLLLISGAFGGMMLFTDIYDDIQSNIVSLLCMSCIKLKYKTQLNFTFGTATGQPHPNFIRDNLTKGPVFLAFRTKVCEACDDMEPIIQEIFSVEFEKEETFYETVNFNGTDVAFIHINLDNSSEELEELFPIYDKDNVTGVPMFTIITLGYDSGFIKPYYVTAYSILSKELLTNIILDGINLYNKFHESYKIE